MSPLKGRPTKTDGSCESKASIVGQDFSPGLNCRAFSHDPQGGNGQKGCSKRQPAEKERLFLSWG